MKWVVEDESLGASQLVELHALVASNLSEQVVLDDSEIKFEFKFTRREKQKLVENKKETRN